MKSGLWKEEHQGRRMTCSRSMLGSLCFHYQHFWSPGHIYHEPTWAVHVFRGTRNCHLECAEGMVQVQSRQGSTLRTVQAFTDGDIAHTSARGSCLGPFKYAPRWYSVAISIVSYIDRVINFKLTTSTTIDSFNWLSRFEQFMQNLTAPSKARFHQCQPWADGGGTANWPIGTGWNVLRVSWFRTFEWHQVLQLRLGDQILGKQSTTVHEIFNQRWLEKRSGRRRYVFSACY